MPGHTCKAYFPCAAGLANPDSHQDEDASNVFVMAGWPCHAFIAVPGQGKASGPGNLAAQPFYPRPPGTSWSGTTSSKAGAGSAPSCSRSPATGRPSGSIVIGRHRRAVAGVRLLDVKGEATKGEVPR